MSAKTYHITLNGKVFEVQIEEVKAGTKPVEVTNNKIVEPISSPSSVSGESVTAPMPGSMFNILVREGQNVKKGEVVAVLEAMKMENEIVAPVDGTISSINVEKGQNVNLGDLILKIA